MAFLSVVRSHDTYKKKHEANNEFIKVCQKGSPCQDGGVNIRGKKGREQINYSLNIFGTLN